MPIISTLTIPNIKSMISIFLILGSLFWVGWIIQSDLTHGLKNIFPKNYSWFFIALIIGVISQFINVLVFSKFLRVDKEKYNILQISRIFFTGQIIRYMPGRVWGILYQVMNTLPSISRNNILLANIELMFISFGGLLTISSTIIIHLTYSWYLSIPIFISGFTFIILVLLNGWLSKIVTIANKFFKKKKQELTILPLSLKACLSATSLLLLSWTIYLFGWIVIGKAGYGSGSSYTMLILASTYSISWFVGYISMITPSGVGVREASFLLLSQGVSSSVELALLAIIIRLWLLVIDLVLFLIFIPVKLKHNKV